MAAETRAPTAEARNAPKTIDKIVCGRAVLEDDIADIDERLMTFFSMSRGG